jgi:hypothetical protein
MVPNDFWGNGIDRDDGEMAKSFTFPTNHLEPNECLVQND